MIQKKIILLFSLTIISIGLFGQKHKTTLEKAIKENNFKKVEKLLTKHHSLKEQFRGCSDLPTLFSLRKANITKNNTKLYLRTMFEIACDCNDTALIKNLINLDSQIVNETIEKLGVTPLMIASEKGTYTIVKLLINNGANVNTLDEEGKNALFYAVKNTDIRIVQYLIKEGASVSQRASDLLAIHHAFRSDLSLVQTVSYLIKKQKLTLRDLDNLMKIAAAFGDIEVMSFLIKNNLISDINHPLPTGKTAMHYAGEFINRSSNSNDANSKKDVLKFLIINKANINLVDNFGFNILYYCRYDIELLQVLLENGADFNLKILRRGTLIQILIDEMINPPISIPYHKRKKFKSNKKYSSKQIEVINWLLNKEDIIVRGAFSSDPIEYMLYQLILNKNSNLLNYWLKDERIKEKLKLEDTRNRLLNIARNSSNKKIIRMLEKEL